MSPRRTNTKRCTNCNRNETLSGARFCRNCSALLPGCGRYPRTERVFDRLAQQIPLSDLTPFSAPAVPYSPPVDLAWARQLAPDPVLVNAPQSPLSPSRRFDAVLTWGLFLLGPLGLIALFVGGVSAVVLGHANYLLVATGFLVVGRLALYGIQRMRH